MSDQGWAAKPPDNVVPNLQHPEDVLHSVNLVSQILAIALTSLFVVLRFYTKTFVAPPFYTDDFVVRIPTQKQIMSLGYDATAVVSE
ncbi:uncharacterized protein ColSpa_11496 [Colletotrichum spaethianum]|uniref:Integral membrane protein n=1 Tax=Colletotrichum spaethianum TaxID=700344 RepID=A0AA37UPS2_9PEZI|nr:uncharacterized protein ColSpa_11496 [Colletotrichum spaethianum]GKT51315.1 hypothetical protein ColSpa_11496 [Colletotrichum spaethianum]